MGRLTGAGLLALLAVPPPGAGAQERVVEYVARDGTGGAWLRWDGGPAVLVPVGAVIPGLGWVTEVAEEHVGLTLEAAAAPAAPGSGEAPAGEALLVLVPRHDLRHAARPIE
jgi:hypothetical protein